MTAAVTSALVIAAVLFNVDGSELFYYDPPPSDRDVLKYLSRGAGSIPRELGEKILTLDKEGTLRADSVVVVVTAEFTIVKNHLRSLVSKELGVAEEHDSSQGQIPPPKRRRPDYQGGGGSAEQPPWPPLGDGLAVFGNPISDKASPREYELTSQPYNRLDSVDGSSEVRIRISDGNALLGAVATVIQIRRLDYSKERARVGHTPFPLPYKEKWRFILVTNTEVELVEQLQQRIPGLTSRYFVPDFKRKKKFWPPMLAGMKEAVANLRKQ